MGQTTKTSFPSNANISECISGGSFYNEIVNFSTIKCPTGFSNMDRFQWLYPGLYVIGGAPSVGKTTFVHQLADQLAANGKTVLYFSLAETRMALVSKSIARECYLSPDKSGFKDSIPTSRDIRRGWPLANLELFDKMVEQYSAKVGNRLVIIDSTDFVTVENIARITEEICNTRVTPVVIVDYLQMVSPSVIYNQPVGICGGIDHIVRSLKVLQTKHNLTMIVVSSIHEGLYNSPITLESLQTSAGGIELVADVVLGMGYAEWIKDDPNNFGKPSLLKTIPLRFLKNKFGQQDKKLTFAYRPAHDYFVAT